MGEFTAKYYQDWYREKKESYEYMLSSEEDMHLSSEPDDHILTGLMAKEALSTGLRVSQWDRVHS